MVDFRKVAQTNDGFGVDLGDSVPSLALGTRAEFPVRAAFAATDRG
jgi:hypothetical protein